MPDLIMPVTPLLGSTADGSDHVAPPENVAPSMQPPAFSLDAHRTLLDLLTWRRDVRAFRRDPLPDGAIERLISIACLSPSVGLSEPWRFVIVADPARRAAIRANFAAANAEALSEQEVTRRALYARLKLAGLDDAPAHIAVFADAGDGQGHGLGRQTMPESINYSVAIAIHTLWLAARIDGIGLGWVSILDPAPLNGLLDVPQAWRLIGYLCLGYPVETDDCPRLQRDGWERRRAPECRVFYR